MILSLPLSFTVSNPALYNFGAGTRRGLRAAWDSGGTERDLGTIASFSGGASYNGSSGALTLAWAREKNPRATGRWRGILAPDDATRVRVFLQAKTPEKIAEAPLFSGVPAPGGITESYTAQGETLEIRLEDVTGAAMRLPHTPAGNPAIETINPLLEAESALGRLPFAALFPATTVAGCIDIFPNALMAADDVLIRRQEPALPLAGRRRVRSGHRSGWILYNAAAEPSAGAALPARYPAGDHDFEHDGRSILSGMAINPGSLRFSLAAINPFIDLGSRIRVRHAPASLDETVEVEELSWSFTPRAERMTLTCRRQQTP